MRTEEHTLRTAHHPELSSTDRNIAAQRRHGSKPPAPEQCAPLLTADSARGDILGSLRPSDNSSEAVRLDALQKLAEIFLDIFCDVTVSQRSV
jgi:hypothetical protein